MDLFTFILLKDNKIININLTNKNETILFTSI
jgi:hypothetical protein